MGSVGTTMARATAVTRRVGTRKPYSNVILALIKSKATRYQTVLYGYFVGIPQGQIRIALT
jgi:hypothetical protein